MAVVNRPCGDFRCLQKRCMYRTFHHGRALKTTCDCLKTQICTVALSLTLFNSVRLPKEAFQYGPVPYLVVYTFWLLAAGLPTTLLQLAMGQLSQQDPVGVWRAVPILRGVGYLRVLSSYISCVYYLMYTALALAYIIWIAKGSFPLKDCTKLHLTPDGYENKMNASECFNSTFLAPFTEYPQYLGIMAVIIFVLWIFVPLLLYRMRKTLKMSLVILTPITVMLGVVLCTFLSDGKLLDTMFESCEQWSPLYQSNIWFSGLVQALLSTQIVSGYMTSAGGSIYRHSDVRWTSASVIMISMFSGWLWVLLWESIGGGGKKDNSFISILVLIYQSSVTERRSKEWPLIAFGVVLFSGVITILTLLFPVYDRLQRLTGDHWRFFATALSAVGTALTVAVLARGLEIAIMLDDLVIPILAVFTTALEIIGFVFIYGWCYLAVDIEFLTGVKLPCFWIGTWWSTPILLIGVTGWWLRGLIRMTFIQGQILWPLVGVFLGILIIMCLVAAVAVAKEEQFNLITKITSAFKPSRLWGPEEPMARYVWMSQRYINETLSSNEANSEPNKYSNVTNKNVNLKDDWVKIDPHQRKYNLYAKNEFLTKNSNVHNDIATIYTQHSVPKIKPIEEEKFRSPNICIAKGELGGPMHCNCNRHFTLNVPDLRKAEVTTSLLYRMRKTLKMSLVILTPITVMLGVVLCTFLSDGKLLDTMFESCEQWSPLYQSNIWFSGLVQALLSTQIVSGYMTSAGGSIYRHSDVRWTSASVIMISMFSGWLWVLLWESIGGGGKKDNSFISILVLIYQSSVTERRSKEWPLIAFGVVLFSGVITILTLLFPVYDRLQRLTGDHWRFFATALSAVGTALTVAVLARGLEIAIMLDDLVIPILAVFTTALEIVGFVFIYGWCYLAVDIEFLTGVKLPCFWIGTWWSTPILLIGVTGWWLRGLIRMTFIQGQILWPLVGVFLGILIIMCLVAAVAVAKEEQFNLITKITSAFKPSRLWGPEEPMARYVWMSQRYINETLSSNEANSEPNKYSNVTNKNVNLKDDWVKIDPHQRKYNLYAKNEFLTKNSNVHNDIATIYTQHSVPKIKPIEEEKFRSPNICIAKGELGGPMHCNCNRHFTLNVPDLRKAEVTTSL